MTPRPPLDGIRVIDISSSYAAPTTSMYLADMGADVIKVEPIRGDDARGWGPPFLNGEAVWFLSVNRNKRSMCIDINSPGGRALLLKMLATADVFIENLNPAKLAKLGLEPTTLAEQFPHLVICALSGFGLTGPDRTSPGYDLIAQARSGMMSVTGAAGGTPQRVSTALSDVAAGTVAAFAVAAALVRQQATGEGEIVDIALLEADLAFMSPRIASYLAGEPEPQPSGGTDSVVAVYQTFDTADRPIVIALGNDRLWVRACEALGLHHLAERDDLATNAGRRQQRNDIITEIQRVLSSLNAHDALNALNKANVPSTLIQSLSEVVADPQVVARDAVVKQTHPVAGTFESVASPWLLHSQPDARRQTRPAPSLGEHGTDILRELDIDPTDSAQLVQEGAVWLP